MGPALKKEIKDEYDQIIQNCILFLSGKNKEIIERLTNEMFDYSSKKEFEKASIIRDKIKHLEQLQDQRRVNLSTNINHYFIGIASNETFHYIMCQQYGQKQFISQKGHYSNSTESFDNFFELTIVELLNKISTKAIIVIDEALSESITRLIELHPKESSITLLQPKKGDLRELLNLANLNAQKSLIGLSNTQLKLSLPTPIETLKKDLNLPHLPNIIFGCDVSHYYGTNIVSSVVVFIDGVPAKNIIVTLKLGRLLEKE